MLAGTSAGAMAMSNTMIYHGSSTEALLKGEVKMSRGLGFIKDVTFDSHFIKRGRFGRLCQSIASNPVCIGIGLGEDTALLITKGDRMESIGSGLVIIVEGDDIKYTNVADIEDGKPISIENLTVHILSQGHSYIFNKSVPPRIVVNRSWFPPVNKIPSASCTLSIYSMLSVSSLSLICITPTLSFPSRLNASM